MIYLGTTGPNGGRLYSTGRQRTLTWTGTLSGGDDENTVVSGPFNLFVEVLPDGTHDTFTDTQLNSKVVRTKSAFQGPNGGQILLYPKSMIQAGGNGFNENGYAEFVWFNGIGTTTAFNQLYAPSSPFNCVVSTGYDHVGQIWDTVEIVPVAYPNRVGMFAGGASYSYALDTYETVEIVAGHNSNVAGVEFAGGQFPSFDTYYAPWPHEGGFDPGPAYWLPDGPDNCRAYFSEAPRPGGYCTVNVKGVDAAGGPVSILAQDPVGGYGDLFGAVQTVVGLDLGQALPGQVPPSGLTNPNLYGQGSVAFATIGVSASALNVPAGASASATCTLSDGNGNSYVFGGAADSDVVLHPSVSDVSGSADIGTGITVTVIDGFAQAYINAQPPVTTALSVTLRKMDQPWPETASGNVHWNGVNGASQIVSGRLPFPADDRVPVESDGTVSRTDIQRYFSMGYSRGGETLAVTTINPLWPVYWPGNIGTITDLPNPVIATGPAGQLVYSNAVLDLETAVEEGVGTTVLFSVNIYGGYSWSWQPFSLPGYSVSCNELKPLSAWIDGDTLAGLGQGRGDNRLSIQGYPFTPFSLSHSKTRVLDACTSLTGWTATGATLTESSGLVAVVGSAGPGSLARVFSSGECVANVWPMQLGHAGLKWGMDLSAYRWLQITVTTASKDNQPVGLRLTSDPESLDPDAYQPYPVSVSQWRAHGGAAGVATDVLFDLCMPNDPVTSLPPGPGALQALLQAAQDTKYPLPTVDRPGWGVTNLTKLELTGLTPGETYTITGIALLRKAGGRLDLLPALGAWQSATGINFRQNVLGFQGGAFGTTLYANRGLCAMVDGRIALDEAYLYKRSGGALTTYTQDSLGDLALLIASHPGWTVSGALGTDGSTYPDNSLDAALLGPAFGIALADDDNNDVTVALTAHTLYDFIAPYPMMGDPFSGSYTGALPVNIVKVMGAGLEGLLWDDTGNPLDNALVSLSLDPAGPVVGVGGGSEAGFVDGEYLTGTPYADAGAITTNPPTVNSPAGGDTAGSVQFTTSPEYDVTATSPDGMTTISTTATNLYGRRRTRVNWVIAISGGRIVVMPRQDWGMGRRVWDSGGSVLQTEYDSLIIDQARSSETEPAIVAEGTPAGIVRDAAGVVHLWYIRAGNVYYRIDMGAGYGDEMLTLSGYTQATTAYDEVSHQVYMAGITGGRIQVIVHNQAAVGDFVMTPDLDQVYDIGPADNKAPAIEFLPTGVAQVWYFYQGNQMTAQGLDCGTNWSILS